MRDPSLPGEESILRPVRARAAQPPAGGVALIGQIDRLKAKMLTDMKCRHPRSARRMQGGVNMGAWSIT
jgi:hypothetical protein